MKQLRNNILIALIISAICGGVACAQGDFAIQYNGMISLVNGLSKSAVYIETPSGTGTGSIAIVSFNDTSTISHPVLITALHVLGSYDSLDNLIHYYDTVDVFMKIKGGGVEKVKFVVVDTSTTYDFAILVRIEKFRPFVDYDITAVDLYKDVCSFSEMRCGQTAIIQGYPFGTGGKEMRPVIQTGILSYIDTTRYFVLVGIPVNYGNSGGPAYCITGSGLPKMLGIITQYVPNKQDYVLRASSTGFRPQAANTSMGKIILSYPIVEAIKKLTRQN